MGALSWSLMKKDRPQAPHEREINRYIQKRTSTTHPSSTSCTLYVCVSSEDLGIYSSKTRKLAILGNRVVPKEL